MFPGELFADLVLVAFSSSIDVGVCCRPILDLVIQQNRAFRHYFGCVAPRGKFLALCVKLIQIGTKEPTNRQIEAS